MIRLTIAEYLSKIGMTRYELSQKAQIRYAILDNYYKNKVVRYDSDVLNRICNALQCNISDIVAYIPDKQKTQS